MRDYQKSKVYAWEDKHIGIHDTKRIDLETAHSVVNYIWSEAGLKYPPKVLPLPTHTKKALGKADRSAIWLQPRVPTWVIIHELAHSMNATIDDNGDRHGPDFVGIYMKLLVKHMNLNLPMLMYTASISNVKFNLYAIPGCYK